jgi:type IV pilus assembly protein PilO
MIEWKQKHTLIVTLTFVLACIIVYSLFVLLVQPKNQQIKNIQNQLDTENQVISSLQQSNSGSSENTILSAVELQKILPVSPFEEQFLLELEKAETISNSLITSISFQDGDIVTAEEEDDELVEAYEEKLDPDAEKGEQEKATDEEIEKEAVPEGLEQITVELSVESPSYYELEDFLQLLENSERITQIESVQVAGQQEIINLVENMGENYQYQVIVSTFYLPGLEELREQLPHIPTPEGSNKKNPFTNLIKDN